MILFERTAFVLFLLAIHIKLVRSDLKKKKWF